MFTIRERTPEDVARGLDRIEKAAQHLEEEIARLPRHTKVRVRFTAMKRGVVEFDAAIQAKPHFDPLELGIGILTPVVKVRFRSNLTGKMATETLPTRYITVKE